MIFPEKSAITIYQVHHYESIKPRRRASSRDFKTMQKPKKIALRSFLSDYSPFRTVEIFPFYISYILPPPSSRHAPLLREPRGRRWKDKLPSSHLPIIFSWSVFHVRVTLISRSIISPSTEKGFSIAF